MLFLVLHIILRFDCAQISTTADVRRIQESSWIYAGIPIRIGIRRHIAATPELREFVFYSLSQFQCVDQQDPSKSVVCYNSNKVIDGCNQRTGCRSRVNLQLLKDDGHYCSCYARQQYYCAFIILQITVTHHQLGTFNMSTDGCILLFL